MIRVGLARGPLGYEGLAPPYGPGAHYREFSTLFGDTAAVDITAGEPRSAPAVNQVYAAVRGSLRGLGLDEPNFGTEAWNPLRELVPQGGSVVLKPNFIRHWNPLEEKAGRGTVESVITHGSILRAAADYAFLAVGLGGSVVIAEAAQQDCDFEVIRQLAGLDALVDFYRHSIGAELGVIDLRREAVRFRDGVIVERTPLSGDPKGYRAVDLAEQSFFQDSNLDPVRFRGADYDPTPTTEHHSGGKNEYLLSETVLSSDLVINLPKLKTHKKTGVTLALKNLVGINGDKNWLPHHSRGAPGEGGDEFPGQRLADRARSRLSDLGRRLLARGIGTRLVRTYRRAEVRARGDDFIRSGNWHGNRTTWRMCADLNRCLYYSDVDGPHLGEAGPVHRVLTILDGIVCGEGNGPLAPNDLPLGVVLAGTDPIAVDLVAVRLMGFDEDRIPKIVESMRSSLLRVTDVRDPEDVQVAEARTIDAKDAPVRLLHLDEIDCQRTFLPHPGWLHHIERTTDERQPLGGGVSDRTVGAKA